MSTPCRTLTLAVTPLVKNIVLASTKGKPLFISRDPRRPFNPYAVHLFALLDRKHMRYFEAAGREIGHEALTDTLEVEIPDWQIRYGGGGEITPARELAFNTFVMKLFRQRLRDEIAIRMETTASIRRAAEQTLLRWGVCEDLYPLSAAVRYYGRNRQEAEG
ncbi:hypothetical protein [Fibrella aquatica]|uniref:hypothetical protein n=1 Tax=Fibrella aquatica TaxID=3242487 RepID=UPI0035224111